MARILIVGDCLSDEFLFVKAAGVDQATGVPRHTIVRTEYRPGGAGNAAVHVAALGHTPILCGACDAETDKHYRNYFRQIGASLTSLLYTLMPGAETDRKRRIVSLTTGAVRERYDIPGQRQPRAVRRELCRLFRKEARAADAILLSDYGKGTLSSSMAAAFAGLALKAGIPVVYDPPPGGGWESIPATYAVPNVSELTDLIQQRNEVPAATPAELLEQADLRSTISVLAVTCGGNGLFFREAGAGTVRHVPANSPDCPVDSTGCGDAVAAGVAVALALGEPAVTAAHWGVSAGTAAARGYLTTPAWADAVFRESVSGYIKDKVLDAQNPWLQAALRVLRIRRKRIVVSNGVFDMLHAGHRATLRWAADQGDFLIALVNSDSSAQLAKGRRPIDPMEQRATALAELPYVDAVIVFSEPDPRAVIAALSPDVLVKGADTEQNPPGADIVRGRGGQIFFAPFLDGYSTSDRITRIRA